MNQKQLMKTLESNRYRGKHLVIIADKVYAAKTGRAAVKLFKAAVKRHPHSKPIVTYIPKADAMILAFHEFQFES